MSRIGKQPVAVPSGVNVQIAGQNVAISGKLGKSSLAVPSEIAVALENGKIVLKRRVETPQSNTQWGTTRETDLPDVPTMIESGFPGLSLGFWAGLWAPAGTPEAVVAKLNGAANAALIAALCGVVPALAVIVAGAPALMLKAALVAPARPAALAVSV